MSTLKRALHIEEYLCRRHKEALEVPPILSNRTDSLCFAVKYFRASNSLQCLYHKIDLRAQKERAAKREELASLNRKSETLLVWTLGPGMAGGKDVMLRHGQRGGGR